MPLGIGALVDGIWKYGESDSTGPLFSDFLNKVGDSIRTRLNAAGIDTAATSWVNPTLSGTWVVNASLTVSYRKVNGIVYCRGQVTGGAIGSTIFQLPAGFRPAQTHKSATTNTDGTSAYRLQVTTAGDVSVNNGGTTATPVVQFSFPIG